MTKRVEHDGDIFEFEDWQGPEQIRAALEDYDARRTRQAQELSQLQALKDEVLRIQKTYSEEIAAVRHEAALARHEAEKARADADEADRLRHEAEERGFPQRDLTEETARLFAGREPGEPASWLERTNEMLRQKLKRSES